MAAAAGQRRGTAASLLALALGLLAAAQVDHLVDKELAGWLHSKSCGQRLNVCVETSDKWHASGVLGWKSVSCSSEKGTIVHLNGKNIQDFQIFMKNRKQQSRFVETKIKEQFSYVNLH
ncbi:uncharacterized protein ACIBXB_007066 [Morphnus guianensis]